MLTSLNDEIARLTETIAATVAVQKLYKLCFDRDPEPKALEFWVGVLLDEENDFGLFELAEAFVTSAEFALQPLWQRAYAMRQLDDTDEFGDFVYHFEAEAKAESAGIGPDYAVEVYTWSSINYFSLSEDEERVEVHAEAQAEIYFDGFGNLVGDGDYISWFSHQQGEDGLEEDFVFVIRDGAVDIRYLPIPEGNLEIDFFGANPSEVPLGSTFQLDWSTDGAEEVWIDNGIGLVPQNGSLVLIGQEDTTYVLTAEDEFGNTEAASVSIDVVDPPSGGGGRIEAGDESSDGPFCGYGPMLEADQLIFG